MRAKFVFEAFESDKEFQARLRKRREEEEQQFKKDMSRFSSSNQPGRSINQDNTISRYSEYDSIMRDPKTGARLSPKELRQHKKKSEAEEYFNKLQADGTILLNVDPDKKNIKQILDWRDEDGNPIPDNAFVLRTQFQDGPIIIYDTDRVSKEHYEKVETAIKTAYKNLNSQNWISIRPITYKNWKTLPIHKQLATGLNAQGRIEQQKPRNIRKPDLIGKMD